MFGPRQILRCQLRYVATQFRPIAPTFIRGSRNASSMTYRQTPEKRIWPRRLLYAGIFGFLGYSFAFLRDGLILEPAKPGSQVDQEMMRDLQEGFDYLPVVQLLRKDPNYIETDVYGNYSGDEKDQRLTSGPLAGSRGLGMQKVFWNNKEKKAINVVHLGNGMEGWPTVVHGGALATILDEHLARVAIQNLPERTAVTANLDVNYRSLSWSMRFYTVHATLDQERSTDRKAYVKGEVRDEMGKLCVEASGLFVVPRGYKLRRLGESY
ncbi:HotDog domain-containing protein [Aspergillus egyptiacus]|nr:HotDog domain-containing protein [Aspergillus egyptiacus]